MQCVYPLTFFVASLIILSRLERSHSNKPTENFARDLRHESIDDYRAYLLTGTVLLISFVTTIIFTIKDILDYVR